MYLGENQFDIMVSSLEIFPKACKQYITADCSENK